MPKGNVPTRTRQRAIIELMNQGITSPTDIVNKLKSDYGIVTTRQTVYRDISNGVEPVTEEILDDYRASMIENLDALSKVAFERGIKGDNKAMDTYTKLVKTKAEVLKKIVEIQGDLKQKERPIYNVKIGEFPKCNPEEIKKQKEIKNDSTE